MRFHSMITAASLLCAAGATFAGQSRPFEKTVAATATGSVEISNVAGEIQIVGWEKSEVGVVGELDAGVERVDVSSSGGRTVVKVILRKDAEEGDANLTVSVPAGCEVNASAVSATVTTKGLHGRQRITTVSGEVTAEVAGADSQIKTVSGDIQLSGNKQPMSLRANTVSGEVSLQRVAGELDVTSVSGDVKVEVDPARSVHLRSTSGDIEFRGQLLQGATLESETINGDTAFKVGGKTGYQFEIQTFNGDLEDCSSGNARNDDDDEREGHGPTHRRTGKVGDGSARINARTMNGDISLCNQ